jgi:hypothetical protein
MPKLLNRVPRYCRHRGSGQAIVTIDHQDIYLGPYGSRASRAEYDRIIAEWIANGRCLPTDPSQITVAEVVANFRRHAKTYYRDADGNVSKALTNIDEALKPVLALYASLPAKDFSPLRLQAARQRMIESGRVRTNINRLVGHIKHVFKWAVSQEMIPPSVFQGLTAVPGLQSGRSGAAESDPVRPVPVEDVEATIPFLSRQVAAMVRLQLLTGMRPGRSSADARM